MKLLILIFMSSSCSFFLGGNSGPKTAKETRYHMFFKRSDWIQKLDKRSDYVFENSKDGRILLSNSFCNEFQEQPLEHLALKAFNGVKNIIVNKGMYKTFHSREAYEIEGSGLVDGINVTLHLLNTRRDNCYFDFIEIASQLNEGQNPIFEQFLNSVEFK